MNDLVLLIKSMVLISLPNFQLGESCWNACLSSMLSIQGITCHTNPSLISIWVPKYKWGCNEYTDKKLLVKNNCPYRYSLTITPFRRWRNDIPYICKEIYF